MTKREKKDININILIGEGVDVKIEGGKIKIAGPKGEIERELWHPKLQIEKKDAKIVISGNSLRKRERALAGTFTAHIKNMITGVKDGFVYKLKAAQAHFPMQISVTKEGESVSVSNFLGERKARVAKIEEGVKVEIKGKEIIVMGVDKEAVGQTASNIERTTKIKGYDPRIFQDGIYLVEKGVGAGAEV